MTAKTSKRPAARRAPKRRMTLIEALNDPKLRADIDDIEDLWSSLDHGDRDEPTLERLLDRACEDFLAETGIDYHPRR